MAGFKLQQEALPFYTSVVTGKYAAAAGNPVAGHEHRDCICRTSICNRTAGEGVPYTGCKPGIRQGCAVGDFQKMLPHFLPEIRPHRQQGYGEVPAFLAEIFIQLAGSFVRYGGGAFPAPRAQQSAEPCESLLRGWIACPPREAQPSAERAEQHLPAGGKVAAAKYQRLFSYII